MPSNGPNSGKPIEAVSEENCEYFWRRVKKGPGCWMWTGKTVSGYGMAWLSKEKIERRAHRLSYAIANGEVPAGKSVMHTCDVPLCVNPSHLRLGTHSDNMRDRVAKGHVPRGWTCTRRWLPNCRICGKPRLERKKLRLCARCLRKHLKEKSHA